MTGVQTCALPISLFEKFAPLPLKAVAGMFPERDLSGFENYADYEKAGAAFRPLPVVEQSNMQDMSRPIRPGYKLDRKSVV